MKAYTVWADGKPVMHIAGWELNVVRELLVKVGIDFELSSAGEGEHPTPEE